MTPEVKQNRAKQMLQNIGIYAIGSISSRLITFMLVPIYSFFIDPSDFGYYDLCFMIVLVLMPFLTLQMRDGSFRFLLDAESDEERSKIVTFTVITLLRNAIISVVLGFLVGLFVDIRYLWLTIMFAIAFSVFDVVQQMLRALGHNKLFAGAGILCSFLIFVLSVPMVAWLDMGVVGVFWGNILARFITLVYIELKVKIFSQYLSRNTDTREVGREIMKFSLPLILVNVIIWTMSSGNRFFIEHFAGLRENGLFAVAQKFAAILEALALIINQAWQETAIKRYGDDDKDQFFSSIFNAYVWVLSLIVIGISFGVKVFAPWIIGAEYYDCVDYVFPLVLSSMLVSVTVFYDISYHCAKATSRQLPALIVAVTMSLLGNYFLTKWIGVAGALLTVNVVYGFMVVYRMIDTRKYIKLSVSGATVFSALALAVSGCMFYVLQTNTMVVCYSVVICVFMLVIMPHEAKAMLMKKLRRR